MAPILDGYSLLDSNANAPTDVFELMYILELMVIHCNLPLHLNTVIMRESRDSKYISVMMSNQTINIFYYIEPQLNIYGRRLYNFEVKTVTGGPGINSTAFRTIKDLKSALLITLRQIETIQYSPRVDVESN
jgi:hypothetical protein